MYEMIGVIEIMRVMMMRHFLWRESCMCDATLSVTRVLHVLMGRLSTVEMSSDIGANVVANRSFQSWFSYCPT
jgi:hypothetical protein